MSRCPTHGPSFSLEAAHHAHAWSNGLGSPKCSYVLNDATGDGSWFSDLLILIVSLQLSGLANSHNHIIRSLRLRISLARHCFTWPSLLCLFRALGKLCIMNSYQRSGDMGGSMSGPPSRTLHRDAGVDW